VEHLEVVEFFAETDEFDRAAGHLADRKRRTAAGVAVELGENEAGEIERAVKMFGDRNRLLAERGVGYQQDFVRPDRLADAHQLLHHGFVDLEAARGVDDDHVGTRRARLRDRVDRDRRNVDTGALGVDRNPDLATDDFELVDRGGTIHVAGHELDLLAVAFEQQRELARRSGFAAAVQTDQHDDGRFRLEREFGNAAAEQFDELVVDDLDHLLTGGHAFDHLLADALGPDSLDELRGDLDIYVGVEQREADFPHRFGDIGFGKGALPTQFSEHVMQLVAERFEHTCHFLSFFVLLH